MVFTGTNARVICALSREGAATVPIALARVTQAGVVSLLFGVRHGRSLLVIWESKFPTSKLESQGSEVGVP